MAKMKVNGVELDYEVIGEGTPLVWTVGGWCPRLEESYFIAGRFATRYKVFIWDRRNTGKSDVALDEDAPSEFHQYAEDLHVLLNELGMTPAYVGGASGGLITSLLFAHLHPDDVKGLILSSAPTMDQESIREKLLQSHYYNFADLAEQKGMEAVANTTGFAVYWPSLCEQNPENKERLLSMPVDRFAALMRKWAEWGPYWCAGLTEEELADITAPAIVNCLMQPPESLHPKASAVALQKRLPNSVFLDAADVLNAEERRSLTEEPYVDRYRMVLRLSERWEDFLDTVESGTFVPATQ